MKYNMIVFFLFCLSSCYQQESEKTGLEGRTVPSFNLLLADSTTQIDTRSIPEGNSIVLCYVGTHCPYSRAEIQNILDNIKSFKDTRFYIFTSEPYKAMKSLYTHYQIEKYPNIIMGVDTSNYFGKYFTVRSVPYTAIYSKDKKLVHAYVGKIDASLIKDIIQKN